MDKIDLEASKVLRNEGIAFDKELMLVDGAIRDIAFDVSTATLCLVFEQPHALLITACLQWYLLKLFTLRLQVQRLFGKSDSTILWRDRERRH